MAWEVVMRQAEVRTALLHFFAIVRNMTIPAIKGGLEHTVAVGSGRKVNISFC